MRPLPARLRWTPAAAIWLAAGVVMSVQLSRHLGGLDVHVYWRVAHQMAHGLSPYSDRQFVYPPFAALLFAPLRLLSWPTTKVIGPAVVVIAIVLTVVISARALRVGLLSWRLAAVTTVVAAGNLFFKSAALGNVSAVIAVLLAVFYLSASRQLDWVAGAVLGASLAIKPMLLPVLVVPLLWARWRMLVATMGSAGVLTGIGALVVPHSGWFVSRALPSLWVAHPASFDLLNSTIASVGHLADMPIALVIAVRVLVVLVALAVVVAVRLRQPKLDAVSAVTVGSAALLAQFCAGALTEDHFLLTLIPLFVMLAVTASPLRPVLAWSALVAISGVVNAPASWYGAGQRAQLSANTSVRLAGQLAVLAALAIPSLHALRRVANGLLRDEPG